MVERAAEVSSKERIERILSKVEKVGQTCDY